MIYFVIPAYNEARNLPLLVKNTSEAMVALGRDYKIFVVNDGSTDNTTELCSAFENDFPLEENFLMGGWDPAPLLEAAPRVEMENVVEQNRDAQMHDLIKLDIDAAHVTRLRRMAHIHGLPIDARSITDEIISQEGK